MHLLLIFIIVVLVVAVLLQSGKRSHTNTFTANDEEEHLRPPMPSSSDSSSPGINPAYLSKGLLFFQRPDGEVQQLQSKHVQALADKLEKSKQQHGWKKDTSWGTSFTGMKSAGVPDSDALDVKCTAALSLDENRLMYFLQDKSFGGLFLYHRDEDKELRLIHKQNLRYVDLSSPNEEGDLLCSSQYSSGVANIVTMDQEGSRYREITGGDSVDSAPYWVATERDQIVFQSQGLARSEEGYVVAHGPSSINLLDMTEGELKTIFSDDQYDYLKPQVSSNGDLYFIRRPYEPPHYGKGALFMDAIKFPFRLLRAVFHYLNFFSMVYSKKPLTSASGPMVQKDLKGLIIQGKWIEAEKALKKERSVNGIPSLVPSSWELIQCTASGDQKVLAKNVSSFRLLHEEGLIYTNGFGIFHLKDGENPRTILKDKLIEEIFL